MFDTSGFTITPINRGAYPKKGEVCLVWEEDAPEDKKVRIHFNEGEFVCDGHVNQGTQGTLRWGSWESLGVIIDIE